MQFDNERDAYRLAAGFGLVPYQEDNLPEYAPDFPVRAFIILRERTMVNEFSGNSMMFPASGHTHYAWGGTWDVQLGEIPPWIPFIRDYREDFVIYDVRRDAEAEAKTNKGKVVLAYLNSKKIVAREYGPSVGSLLRQMGTAEHELMSRHDVLLAEPRLIRDGKHIKGIEDSLEAIGECHKRISLLAPPKDRRTGHDALIAFSTTMATAAEYYRRSFLALQRGNFEDGQRHLDLAGRHFELAKQLRRNAVAFFGE